MKHRLGRLLAWVIGASFFGSIAWAASPYRGNDADYRSPIGLAICEQRDELYVANHSASILSIVGLETRSVVEEVALGSYPTDLVVSPDGAHLYVSSLYDYCIQDVDLETRKVVRTVKVGYEPYGLTVSSDGARLFVANSISNSVAAISTDSFEVLFESAVGRNPRYLQELPKQGLLVVTNGLSRNVTYLDSHDGTIVETRDLERASLLRDIVTIDDGAYAIAAGLIAHDEVITMQIERGWINSNGLYVMEVGKRGHFVTVPLDSLLDGAANPWGLAVSSDNQRLYVSLAGVHEVAFVDLPKLLSLVKSTEPRQVKRLSQDVEVFDNKGLGKRFETGGLGPRGLVLDEARDRLYVANFFSNNLSVMNARTGEVEALVALGSEEKEMSLWRRGQLLFNDARMCQQNYYSCASCHQEDGTMDGLNWDLINDGKGNPKNAKSLHDAVDTPPVMWSGVRMNMFAGVAAGQRFLGFIPNEANHEALLAFLGKPPRAPNPYINEDPSAIARGETIFNRSRCNSCHIAPTYVDGKKHDLGLRASFEVRSRFYTPSLREVYRTGPYLHHGTAETLEEVFKDHNPDNKHGLTQGLTDAEIADLVAYLKTL